MSETPGLHRQARFDLTNLPTAVATAKASLLSVHTPQFSAPVMDKFWSIFTMPMGVALCFGPAIVVWWLTRDKEPACDDSKKKH